MRVEVLSATQFPLEVISLAAGTCYGKYDVSEKRVETCFNNGHMSVFEHASATFSVEGISRSCSHQLVRHRLASYSQRSQRYTKLTQQDLDRGDWFVTPPRFTVGGDDSEGFHIDHEWFADRMYEQGRMYIRALEAGVKPEDARYLLPEATKTDIAVTMNLRELYHFLAVRDDSHAQWEIREMAAQMRNRLASEGSQWAKLLLLAQ